MLVPSEISKLISMSPLKFSSGVMVKLPSSFCTTVASPSTVRPLAVRSSPSTSDACESSCSWLRRIEPSSSTEYAKSPDTGASSTAVTLTSILAETVSVPSDTSKLKLTSPLKLSFGAKV